jgi:hypothetical protein
MSEGVYPEDWEKTCKGNLDRRKPNTNWLGHLLGKQTSVIDELIYSGKYTVDEIAYQLASRFPNSTNDHDGWLFRIGRHVAHLEWLNDGGGKPHNLVVREDKVDGKLSFDCSETTSPKRPIPTEGWGPFNAREFTYPHRRKIG